MPSIELAASKFRESAALLDAHRDVSIHERARSRPLLAGLLAVCDNAHMDAPLVRALEGIRNLEAGDMEPTP